MTFEAFEIELQNTLYNLSDPDYIPENFVFQALDVPLAEGLDGMRKKLIDVIEQGANNQSETETAKTSFLYQVLYQRFVRSLSQEKAAEVLEISSRHLRRKQSEAIRALAVRLWGQSSTEGAITESTAADEPASGSAWAEMLLREIEILNHHSPGITPDLGKVIQKAVEMARYLHQKDGILVEVGEIPGRIEIAVHPNVLRQAIFFILRQVIQSGYKGEIELGVVKDNAQTALVFRTAQGKAISQEAVDHIQELAEVLGGKAEIHTELSCCLLQMVFLKSKKISVLVVDDNYETIQLFRRFTLNSRFEIHHFPGGADLIAQIQTLNPDILVMDVLLPGQDGWDLLMQIRQHAATATLPVIVSSVIGDPEIAHSLGANDYLPKPVDQKSLLHALEAVLKN